MSWSKVWRTPLILFKSEISKLTAISLWLIYSPQMFNNLSATLLVSCAMWIRKTKGLFFCSHREWRRLLGVMQWPMIHMEDRLR